MVKGDRPLPDRPFSYIISGHNKSTLPSPPRPGGRVRSFVPRLSGRCEGDRDMCNFTLNWYNRS
jgi:hypothetical protein